MKQRLSKRLLKNDLLTNGMEQYGGILIALILLCVVISFLSPYFLSVNNFFNVLRQSTTTIMLGMALAFVLISGGIDLSVGASLSCCSCVSVVVMLKGYSFPVALLVALAVGALFGFINGFVISRTTIPAFIVTLSTMNIYRSIGYMVTGGTSVKAAENKVFRTFGAGYLAEEGLLSKVPVPVVVTLIVAIIMAFVLNKTRFSRHMFAAGGNDAAATYSGVNVKNVRLITYTISGVLGALAGVMYAARMNSGQPAIGVGWECDGIAAAVLGGVSFLGGRGTVVGVILGGLVITVVNNGLNLMEVSYQNQLLAKGIVILLAVYVDELKRKKSGG